MEHLSVPDLLGMCSSYISDRILHMGTTTSRICGTVLIAGAASGCQLTVASGDLSTGEFKVTSMRVLTETGLGVKGPKGSEINLSSSPDAQTTDKLVEALTAVAIGRRLQATEIEDEGDDGP